MKEDIKEQEHTECNETCSCNEDTKCNKDCNEECHCDETCDCKKTDKVKKKKDKHSDKLNEAYNKISELEDKLLREKAELINYRKRKEEEIGKMLKYSNEDMARDLLPIVDNFERAIKMDDENLTDEVSKFLSGFKMIYCKVTSTLEKYEIKAIDGANKPFDPTYHQAVMTEHKDGVESGMVLEVLQKGYLLKDKVIRPAMVRVSE